MLRLDLQVAIGAQRGDGLGELRRVAVHLRFEIGIGEDEVLGDVAQLDVAGEERHVAFLRRCVHRQIGAQEQGSCREQPEIAGNSRQLLSFDEGAPQDDVRVEDTP